MFSSLFGFFNKYHFMPHGSCYLWTPELVWLHVVADGLIALAYFTIPVALVYFVRRRRDVPFNWMFVLFGIFILACGGTHLMEVWTVWHANYWISGAVKAVTALASVPTAILLIRLVPRALTLPTPRRLEQANRRLSRAVDALQEANAELESFAYSVSHDLRAPLRAIDGFSRILEEDFSAELPSEARHYLTRVQENARQMSELVDDLLAFSRLSRQPLEKRSVEPARLVGELAAELQEERNVTQAEIVVGELPPCQADSRLLRQVWFNLLSNALKFSRQQAQPRIEITGWTADGFLTYQIKDNGVGFNMKYSDRLFGVFQRLHRSEDFEGTGVGLAIVQRIIHRHGGRVWAEAAPDQGATFRFTLPVDT